MSYFSGQGKIYVAPIINGVIAGGYRWVGNVPDFKPTFDTAKLEHKESFSGARVTDKTITTEITAKVSATLEDWSPENLALAVRASVADVAAGTVTALAPEIFPSGLVNGDLVSLKHQNVSALSIVDSAGVPAALVLGTDYTVDVEYGSVTILDISGFTQPFKANYAFAAGQSTALFTESAKEVAMRFEGVNTAENNQKVIVELYKVSLDPTKELGLISNDLAGFVIEGNALLDATKPANDPVFGQFGRIIFVA